MQRLTVGTKEIFDPNSKINFAKKKQSTFFLTQEKLAPQQLQLIFEHETPCNLTPNISSSKLDWSFTKLLRGDEKKSVQDHYKMCTNSPSSRAHFYINYFTTDAHVVKKISTQLCC